MSNPIEPFHLFEEYNPAERQQQLKRRELQNIQRYKDAQERGDNYAIKYYEFRMKLDKIDSEKAMIRKEMLALKKKFKKL